jgi:hypothetical protein
LERLDGIVPSCAGTLAILRGSISAKAVRALAGRSWVMGAQIHCIRRPFWAASWSTLSACQSLRKLSTRTRRVPWTQEEIDFIRHESLRTDLDYQGTFSDWIAPQLAAHFGTVRTRSGIDTLRVRHGIKLLVPKYGGKFWPPEEVEFVRSESLRIGPGRMKSFDEWIAPQLEPRFGTPRTPGSIGEMRQRYGIQRDTRQCAHIRPLGFDEFEQEICALTESCRNSRKRLSIKQYGSLVSQKMGIPPLSQHLAKGVLRRCLEIMRLRKEHTNGATPRWVDRQVLKHSRALTDNPLRTLHGLNLMIQWLQSFDASPEAFPWKQPAAWAEGVNTLGLSTTHEEMSRFLVQSGLKPKERDKMGQEPFRQHLLAKSRMLVARAERNAEQVLVTGSKSSGRGRCTGPGEIRAIRRYCYKCIAKCAIAGQRFRPVELLRNHAPIAAELDLTFPNGYQDGGNLGGQRLKRILHWMCRTPPSSQLSDRGMTKSSYGASLNYKGQILSKLRVCPIEIAWCIAS